MAAPKGEDKINKLFDEVITLIAEKGLPTVRAIKGKMSSLTFFDLIAKDEEKLNKYTRACQMRSEKIEDETITIADSKSKDVNRDKLRVETRKWLLAKLHPKKYGDRTDITTDGKPLPAPVNITVSSDKAKQEIEKLSAND